MTITTPAEMTKEQRNLARHALGLPNKRKQTYRNHFVTGEGRRAIHIGSLWLRLVSRGDSWKPPHRRRRPVSPDQRGRNRRA